MTVSSIDQLSANHLDPDLYVLDGPPVPEGTGPVSAADAELSGAPVCATGWRWLLEREPCPCPISAVVRDVPAFGEPVYDLQSRVALPVAILVRTRIGDQRRVHGDQQPVLIHARANVKLGLGHTVRLTQHVANQFAGDQQRVVDHVADCVDRAQRLADDARSAFVTCNIEDQSICERPIH